MLISASYAFLSSKLCEKRQGRSYSNYSLITVIHLGELPYKCKHCDEKFKTLEAKKKHTVIVHLGEKFGCDICGQQFAHPTSLGKHLKRVHNTNKVKLKALVRDMKQKEKDGKQLKGTE